MDDLKLTRQQKLNQLGNAEREAQRLRQELGVSGGDGGSGGGSDPAVRVQKEDQDATLFDRLSPAELTALYQNDRPRWEEIIKAKEGAGLRRLFRGHTP